ncbi:uncharacterized protein J3R85_001648 [Psidium guajava]|nr:uncharacterized protein J3R85_001648 [Psidium guajava]
MLEAESNRTISNTSPVRQFTIILPKTSAREITGCHGLNFVPPFPQVEYLKIGGGKMLEEQLMANPNSEGSTFNLPLSNLKRLHLSEVYLEPLMLERLLRLASHLEYMSFSFCGDLMGLSHGMQHFSSLQELDITGCWGIDFSCQENEHGIVAQFLPKLHVLKMSLSSDLVTLPEWIQHVTTLQHLEISRWKHLKSLPTWIENLSLLEKLVISDCERLVQWPFEMLRNLTCFCLKEIRIHRCPALKSCLTNGPEDWPVIAWEDESEYEQ